VAVELRGDRGPWPTYFSKNVHFVPHFLAPESAKARHSEIENPTFHTERDSAALSLHAEISSTSTGEGDAFYVCV